MDHLSIEQVQGRLLKIAVEVDKICRRHDIPLFMIAGTMLGAIRHRGFIPWDDDMDFAVPYNFFFPLIEVLRNELPENLQCLAYNESETYKCPWIKIEDKTTLVIDHSLDLPNQKMPGLTIDVFPLVRCKKGECVEIVKKIQTLISFQRVAYGVSPGSKYSIKNISKRVFRFVLPISQTRINSRIIKLMNQIESGNDFIIPVDPNYYNRFFPSDWFFPLTRFPYDNVDFFGPAEYDKYLTEVYHDYMQLPPEEKRRVHCENVFLK